MITDTTGNNSNSVTSDCPSNKWSVPAFLNNAGVQRCYQCGKCSSGCPAASHMNIKPHRMIRLLQDERISKVKSSTAIWMCIGCQTCWQRCPKQVDMPRVIDMLKHESYYDGSAKGGRPLVLYKALLNSVRRNGRIYETGLLLGYNFKSLKLLNDMDLATRYVKAGKLSFVPDRVKRLSDVREVFRSDE